jgi:hypothetical protein
VAMTRRTRGAVERRAFVATEELCDTVSGFHTIIVGTNPPVSPCVVLSTWSSKSSMCNQAGSCKAALQSVPCAPVGGQCMVHADHLWPIGNDRSVSRIDFFVFVEHVEHLLEMS